MWDRSITCTASTLGYWQDQSKYSDTALSVAVGSFGVSKVTLIWSRTTPAGTREDLVTTNLHLAVHNVAHSYAKLTDTQKSDAETDLNAWIVDWQGKGSNAFTFAGYSWHDIDVGDAKYGPADRLTSASAAGGNASSRLPDQISANVTFRTSSRKHWGRIYIPGYGLGSYETTFGRIGNTSCDAIALSTRTLANALAANTASTEIVVFSKAYQAVLSVDEIVCDNVPDVVRRRRPKQASYRKVYTS